MAQERESNLNQSDSVIAALDNQALEKHVMRSGLLRNTANAPRNRFGKSRKDSVDSPPNNHEIRPGVHPRVQIQRMISLKETSVSETVDSEPIASLGEKTSGQLALQSSAPLARRGRQARTNLPARADSARTGRGDRLPERA